MWDGGDYDSPCHWSVRVAGTAPGPGRIPSEHFITSHKVLQWLPEDLGIKPRRFLGTSNKILCTCCPSFSLGLSAPLYPPSFHIPCQCPPHQTDPISLTLLSDAACPCWTAQTWNTAVIAGSSTDCWSLRQAGPEMGQAAADSCGLASAQEGPGPAWGPGRALDRRPGFRFGLCHSPAVWFGAKCLASLGLLGL